jgi:hypothetical protein
MVASIPEPVNGKGWAASRRAAWRDPRYRISLPALIFGGSPWRAGEVLVEQPATGRAGGELKMSSVWSSYWRDIRNLRWTDVDQVVLEKVANTLGWGPERSLLELGAGRGLHSRLLYETMRCDRPDLYEVSPEMLSYMERQGLNAVGDDEKLRRSYDVVWSYGVPEHFEDPMRQDIIDRHFELSNEWVLVVIPRSTWLR